MPLGRTRAVALLGLEGVLVDVEAAVGNGLPRFVLIGLPDAALRQAEHRVHAAAMSTGCPLPTVKLTINLSPAALPKFGSGFDLAIAMSALAANEMVPAESIERVVHLGELGLDGRLRPIVGILPAVLALARAGHTRVMVPTGNADEAALVPGITVVGVTSLRDALLWHGGDVEPEVAPAEPIFLPHRTEPSQHHDAELSEIIGNEDAVEAMIAAAAGGHHVFMVGPPGAGKTMLASRLPGLLPDLTTEAAIEVSSIRSLAGLPVGSTLSTRPPFESPHHTASAVALIGGGSGVIRPGAAVRSSHGVLFLDEAPEFASNALDALRQPLESGTISIHRANSVAHFPGRFQLVMAANPCPCGQWGARDANCTCAPFARRRYLARISGPLLDRIDIQLRVNRITAAQLRVAQDAVRATTADAQRRVADARAIARARLEGTPWMLNCQVPGAWLRAPAARLSIAATASIDRALERGGITMRGYDRVLRLGWTLADLDGAATPGADHIGRALYLRKAMSS